jgi:hypothetical protein
MDESAHITCGGDELRPMKRGWRTWLRYLRAPQIGSMPGSFLCLQMRKLTALQFSKALAEELAGMILQRFMGTLWSCWVSVNDHWDTEYRLQSVLLAYAGITQKHQS